jgi:transcription initiation factor TFIIIB Brf1 subunit/transcription initiation factor TFIIB
MSLDEKEASFQGMFIDNGSDLDFQQILHVVVLHILELHDHGASSCREYGAAALYLACKSNNERMTQKRIADAAGVSTISMRNRPRELEVLF